VGGAVKRFTCEQARQCLDELLDGAVLEDAQRTALDVHMDFCGECSDYQQLWTGVEGVMRNAPMTAAQRGRAAGVGLGRVGLDSGHRFRNRLVLNVLAVAAAAALVLGILPRLLMPRQSPSIADEAASPSVAPPAPAQAPVDARTNAEGPLEHTLPMPLEAAPPPTTPSDPRSYPTSIDSGSGTSTIAPQQLPDEPQATLDGAAAAGLAPLDALPEQPPEVSEQAEAAFEAMESGRLDDAHRLAMAEVQARPTNPRTIDMLAQLAQAYRYAQQYEAACAIYQQVIDDYPNSAAARSSLVTLGQLELGALARPDEALLHFEAYLQRVPAGVLSGEARLGKVRALFELGRHDDLIAACGSYLSHHPEGSAIPEVLCKRGDALRATGDLAAAAADYRQVVSGWSTSPYSERASSGLLACGVDP